MKVNKNNYEIYFLDYHEGNLSANEQAELFLFLEQHPALKKEFENFEQINISAADEIIFPDKNILKRELITGENYQQFLIANLEGDLNEGEQQELNKFLFQHPDLRKEDKLFSFTKLVADKKIVFPGKSKLKQAIPITEKKRKAFYFSVAAAACVILLIGIYFVSRNGSNESMEAVNQPKKEVIPIQQKENKTNNTNTIEQKEKLLQNDKPALAQNPVKQKNRVIENKVENLVANNNSEKLKNNSPIEEVIEPIVKKDTSALASIENQQPKIELVNPSLIKKKMIKQLEKDPLSYSAKDFDAYLDKVSNPDSSFTTTDLDKPVFASSAPVKKTETPILDALAWGINKVSGKDVTLNKNYNHEGELVAYRFESGNLKFGKSPDK